MLRIVVTGGSGYVGGRLLQSLHRRGVAAVPLVRAHRSWLPDAVPGIDLLASDLDPLLDSVDTVIHLAGHNETVAATDSHRAIHESLTMTERLVQASTRAGVERMVFVSTVHVYGRASAAGRHVDETVAPEPTSAYAISRLCCEHVVRAAPFESVILRLSNAVGAPVHVDVDRWTLLASDLVRGAVTKGQLTLRTPGLQWRDFVDLGYVGETIAAAAEPDFAAGTYNLASGRSCTVRQLAQTIHATATTLVGRPLTLQIPEPDSEPTAAPTLSVDRLRSQGVGAPPPVERSIEELVRFCLDNEDRL